MTTTIELADHVAKDFLDIERHTKVFNRHNLPFETFSVQFAYRVIRSPEEITTDALKEVVRKFGDSAVDGMINDLRNKRILGKKEQKALENASRKIADRILTLTYQTHINKGIAELKDEAGTLFIRFSLNKLLPFPEIEYNDCHTRPEYFALQLLNLMGNVIYYLEKPREEIQLNETRALSHVKKNKKGKPGRKVYINKKVYRFLQTPREPEEKRAMERHVDSWHVRGHWRHLKSGKKVWVKAHVKGNRDAEPDIKPYRIASH